MIGDDLEGIVVEIGDAGFFRRGFDQRLKQIDVIVAVHVLQHRRDALQAHTGIDAGFGQGMQGALLVAVELHEHQIPNFDVAIAIGIGAARRPAGDVRAMVVKNFRAGAAGAGVTHLPEVIALVGFAAGRVAHAHNALLRHADVVGPMVIGFVVGLINGHPKLFFRQAVFLSDQFPREADGILLEIIAEAEIAEHFEKRMVARGVADVFQVVVLASGAHAALRGGGAVVGALVLAEEYVFKLHHACVGE